MFRRTYKVKGEDVDDFMVMQDFAYHSYISSILHTFLFENGYCKRKLKTLKMDWKQCSKEFVYIQHLMFTQRFFLNLEVFEATNNTQNIRSRFFNSKNELCAVVTTQLYWVNNNYKEVIIPPRRVLRSFVD